jgi:hypothetical protein
MKVGPCDVCEAIHARVYIYIYSFVQSLTISNEINAVEAVIISQFMFFRHLADEYYDFMFAVN